MISQNSKIAEPRTPLAGIKNRLSLPINNLVIWG